MTTPVIEKLTDLQTQIVNYVSKVQEPVTKGVSTVVDFVAGRVEEIPAVPFAEQIPTPKELIDNQYKFSKQLLDTQKALALAVAKAAAPLTDQVLDRRTAARRSTTKASA
jgi:hypothetical protein